MDGVGFYKWSTDQMLLNWWVKKEQMKVKNMDWRWNHYIIPVEKHKQKESYFEPLPFCVINYHNVVKT